MTVIVNDYFLLPPNWGDTFNYKRIWRTSIQFSIDAHEKRSALFTWPRRNLRFSIITLTAQETNYMIRKFYKNLHNVWGIPYWINAVDLTSQASSGQAVLNAEAITNLNFEVGAECIIFVDENNYEVGTILSLTTNTITLDANLSTTWASGITVYPILKTRLQLQQTASQQVVGVSEFELSAIEIPDTDVIHTPLTTALFPVYKSKSVFNILPNWESELKLELNHNFDQLKWLGKEYSSSIINETTLRLSMNFLKETNSETDEILAFFDDHKGRCDRFWLPSQNNDIIITSGFLNTDITFDIEDIDWTVYWDEMNTAGHHIQFRFSDGASIYREITSMPTTTSMTIDSAIGVDVSQEELVTLTVSFLYQARFDIDEIEATKPTYEISEFNLKFATIYGAQQ